MNKMTKGAIATGVGVILLAGGGGTLAVWNETVNANAGTITSGNLDLTTTAGVWTADGVAVSDISTYKVVPGETLTYTQDVDVTLAGDNISANLTATGIGDVAPGFDAGTYTVSDVTLTDTNGAAIANPLTSSVSDVTASLTFEFLEATEGLASTNATYDFSNVAFVLQQVAPSDPTTTP